MLNLIGAIVGMGTIAVNLVAFTGALGGTLSRRLGIASIGGAWVGLASGLGAAGVLAFVPDNPVPVVGVLCALPIVLVLGLAIASPRARAALLAVPASLLIGLNAMRMLGVLFLFLEAAGRLGGPFPFSAGLGDIATGALAIPLAIAVARGRATPAAIRAWNLFGTLDLVVAVTLGVTSANGTPLQLIHAGAGSEAMQHLPFCLVPTVLVPFYLITHGIVAAQLATTRTAAANDRNVHGVRSAT